MDKGFTVTSESGLLRVLKTPCRVSPAFDPANGVPEFQLVECEAIWDTGAGTSVITQRVVEACGLKPIRKAHVKGVHGTQTTDVYMVNIYLPSKVAFFELEVFKGNPPAGWWDVLIGMDIIAAGDFSVRNVNSKTEWTFSVPSQHQGTS